MVTTRRQAAAQQAEVVAAAIPSTGDTSAFKKSVITYAVCLGGLGCCWLVTLAMAPSVSSKACDGLGATSLLDRSQIAQMWRCGTAYQEKNEYYVFFFFMLVYIGLKMFAIPAAFSLCVLAGALFPLPMAQAMTGFGEAFGSSACYLLSSAIASPIVERLMPDKMRIMQAKVAEEKDYMYMLNLFLRLTPFAPNWFINISAPLVGIPLTPFFICSLFGTQCSLFFLALTGSTLRQFGESGFDLGREFQTQLFRLGLVMGVLQCVPLIFIWYSKRLKAKKAS